MNKFFKIFLIVLALISHTQLEAKNYYIKGEIVSTSISPLFVFQKINTSFKMLYLKANKFYDEEEYDESLKAGLSLLSELEKTKNVELKYLTNLLIGNIFKKRNNHDKALAYFKKSLKIIKFRDDFNEQALIGLGSGYLKNTQLADNLLRIGTEYSRLKKVDSARIYYEDVIKMESLSDDIIEVKAKAYNNLSGTYIEELDYEIAREYALKAVEMHRKSNDKLLIAGALNNFASIFLMEKKYDRAKEIYSEAIDLIKFDESIKALKDKENLYYNLAYVLYKQKNYKAYEYFDQSYILKETLSDREFRRIVKGVYAEYSIQYKVERLKDKAAQEEAEARRSAWLFGILSLLVIISSGVILYNYKLRQNNLKLKLIQTQSAQESKLEKLKSESQVRILNATLDGKETERKQIAETLHDSVSSLLSSANLHLQATKMQFNGDTPIEIDKTQKIIIEASQTIRDLSHTLVSSVLLKFGLKYAIIDMAEKYSNSQIQINTDIKNLRRYHQNFEIKVNNIIQEFVNNILKHSKASKSIVRIEDKEGKLIINIQDNGIGFDKKVIPEKDGLGINQIDARIQMMKGEFNIDSNSENGTKIAIVLPILEKEIPIRV